MQKIWQRDRFRFGKVKEDQGNELRKCIVEWYLLVELKMSPSHLNANSPSIASPTNWLNDIAIVSLYSTWSKMYCYDVLLKTFKWFIVEEEGEKEKERSRWLAGIEVRRLSEDSRLAHERTKHEYLWLVWKTRHANRWVKINRWASRERQLNRQETPKPRYQLRLLHLNDPHYVERRVRCEL